MSTKSKTLAKSLHTVSAVVSVARLIQTMRDCPNATVAVGYAVLALGYGDASDPYMLAARAVAILESGK